MLSFSEKVLMPIVDLHCDLLCYLAHDKRRTAYDLAARCAIPQLKNGNVKLQTMAIFTETGSDSIDSGMAQAAIFKTLPKEYPEDFYHVYDKQQLKQLNTSEAIGICYAIENASSFCNEIEALETGFQRLEIMMRRIGKPVYISLTWNTENRFGGGAHTKSGLKNDGKKLLHLMSQKKIAIDLSHASDYLTEDIFNYLEKQALTIPVLASHSNFRSVADTPRNLPETLAKAILDRNGIIGLNFVRQFVGYNSPENFARQLEYAFKLTERKQGHKGKGIGFGADFFFGEDVSAAYRKAADDLFFPGYNHAGSYAQVIKIWKNHLSVTDEDLASICYGNAVEFLAEQVYC